MMNDNENMVSDAVAQDMELTDPQGSEPQSADAKNAQEASSNDDFHRTGRMQLYVRRFMRRPLGRGRSGGADPADSLGDFRLEILPVELRRA